MSVHDDPDVQAAQQALDEWEAQEAPLIRALGQAIRKAQDEQRRQSVARERIGA